MSIFTRPQNEPRAAVSCPQCPSNPLPALDYNIFTNIASGQGFATSNILCQKQDFDENRGFVAKGAIKTSLNKC